MGSRFTDRFSLLHFAVGIVAYYWNVSFIMIIVIHVLFEYVENTDIGMRIINKYITLWPGGKDHPDSFLNSLGDTVYTAVGWGISYWLDQE